MVKKIVFFNNKGGVGKTTLVYHIAYMMAEIGKKVLVADLDPQANLTAMFLTQERLEEVFLEDANRVTITDFIEPVIEGEPYPNLHIESISENISLLIGNLALSTYEDNLSKAWTECLNGDVYSFKIVTLFNKIMDEAALSKSVDFVLIDVGPNLGAINRSILVASDFVILPVTSDLFALQGIKNLGKTLTIWTAQWLDRASRNPKPTIIPNPKGLMKPVGYIAMQHTSKDNRPVKAYLKWANRIPATYNQFVLHQQVEDNVIETDPNCLGMLRHYNSLMPMAMEARKPIFLLRPADGAIGAHYQAVLKVKEEFMILTKRIIEACQVPPQ